VAPMRRRDPEPPPGPPRIEFKPGMANELLRELAPLLAEEGIDVDNIDVPDIETLRRAMNRAVERRNMALFTPVGERRDLAAATLRLVVEALAEGNSTLASSVLDQVQPESPDNSAATVSACTGMALGLLDEWLGGHDPAASTRTAIAAVIRPALNLPSMVVSLALDVATVRPTPIPRSARDVISRVIGRTANHIPTARRRSVNSDNRHTSRPGLSTLCGTLSALFAEVVASEGHQ
jgi:hypothetical protein